MLDNNLNNKKSHGYKFKPLNDTKGIYTGKESETSEIIYIDMIEELKKVSKIYKL